MEFKVSICIPTYNSSKYLRIMFDSILNQTYKDFEVIISDNASNDNTFEIAQEYCSKYGWTYYQNDVNIGAGANFNKLIELARGKFISIYHADDIYAPTIIEETVKLFDKYPDIGLVGTMGNEIDKNGIIHKSISLPKSLPIKDVYTFEEIFTSVLSQERLFLVTPSVTVKAEAYHRYGNFNLNKRYKSAGDYEMWFRIMQGYKLGLVNNSLIQYRYHEAQGSHHEIRTNIKKPDSLNVYLDYAKINYNKYGTLYEYSYYRLMRILAIKLNNSTEFSKSNQVIFEIIDLNTKFKINLVWLLIMNRFRLKVNLNSLITIKKILKKIGILK